jgi:hypothetical protein
MLATKLIPVKRAALDPAAAGRLVDSSNTKIITNVEETRQMTLIGPLPCDEGSDGSFTVYASSMPFAIYFSDSYGFVILT